LRLACRTYYDRASHRGRSKCFEGNSSIAGSPLATTVGAFKL
jgi:hypothetical protein